MILLRRVSLDGIQLDETDRRILIQGIEPGAGKDTLNTIPLGGRDGSRVTGERRESLDVAVRFSINEKSYRPEERAAVFEAVMAWAGGGGWLRCGYKPERKIRVFAAQLPAEGDILNRGNQYSITFRACGVPWWQEDSPQAVIQNGQDTQNIQVRNNGTKTSPLEIQIKNMSGVTVPSVQVSSGSDRWLLSGVNVGPWETLVIDHDDNGRRCVQRIRVLDMNGRSWRSALSTRTGSDEILLSPGNSTVQIRSAGAWTATLTVPGRFW